VLRKSTLIVLLAGANAFLLAMLIALAYSPPAAFAQAPSGRAGDFSCVSAKPANQSEDVVYILDRPQHRLHTYYTTGNGRNLKYSYGGFRDLRKDFNIQ